MLRLPAMNRSHRKPHRLPGWIAVVALCLGCASAPPPPPPGAGEDKVVLCHKGKQTLRVAKPAVEAHRRHGDTLGPCR